MKNNLRKNFIWNLLGTSLSSTSSLFFLIMVTRINGVDDAGLFSFSFTTACLFYVIGVYSGRTFQITDNEKKITDSDYFYSKMLTCLIMIVVTLLFCLIRQYSFVKSLIIMELAFYKMLEAFSESTFAILQKNDELYKVGKSLFFKSLFSLLLFFIVDYLTKNILLASTTIIICNLLFIIFYDIKNLKKIRFKLKSVDYTKVKRLLKKGFYAFGFTFLSLYVINASKYSIDYLLSDDNQTIYGIIAMPATVLILFGQYIIQPFLVMLKENFDKSINNFIKLVLKICIVLFILGLLCVLVAFFLGIPVLELLYGIKLNDQLLSLIVIILGGTFYAISTALSTSLTIMQHTKSQFIVFVITSIFATILSYFLVKNHLVLGACLSYMFSMLFLLILYTIDFIIKINKARRI